MTTDQRAAAPRGAACYQWPMVAVVNRKGTFIMSEHTVIGSVKLTAYVRLTLDATSRQEAVVLAMEKSENGDDTEWGSRLWQEGEADVSWETAEDLEIEEVQDASGKPLFNVDDTAAIMRIRTLLDGAEWDSDTIDAVADAVRSTGRSVDEPKGDNDNA